MLTKEECATFVTAVYGWRQLPVSDHDEAISRTLSRFAGKSQLNEIRRPDRWLLRAAKLVARELCRERRARNNLLDSMKHVNCSDRRVNSAYLHVIADRDGDQIENHANSPKVQIVRQVLDDLSPIDRQIAELCGIAELHPAEVGRRLSMPRSTVKSRWQRLRRKLSCHPDLHAILVVQIEIAIDTILSKSSRCVIGRIIGNCHCPNLIGQILFNQQTSNLYQFSDRERALERILASRVKKHDDRWFTLGQLCKTKYSPHLVFQ